MSSSAAFAAFGEMRRSIDGMETRTKFARESLALSQEKDLDDVHARRDVFALLIVAILLLKMDAFCEDIFYFAILCYLDVKSFCLTNFHHLVSQM